MSKDDCIATDEHIYEDLGCEEELRLWNVTSTYAKKRNNFLQVRSDLTDQNDQND